jgi:hypothetical protein
MTRTRCDLVEILGATAPDEQNNLGSFGAVAEVTFASPLAGTAAYIIVYGYTLLGNASYILVIGQCIQQMLWMYAICVYEALAIGCAVLLLPTFLIRQLGETVALCAFNTALIIAVLIVALISIWKNEKPHSAPAFSPNLSFTALFGSLTNIVYSYCGQWMYFELMDTMEVPREFPHAFCISGPVMVMSYLMVAIVGYLLTGGGGSLIDHVDKGPVLSVVAAMLLVHVLIVYVIKSVVLARYLHGIFSPGDIHKGSKTSYLKHGCFGSAMLAFSYLVANAVPFFNELVGLIGGFLGGPINFLFPIALFLVARGRKATMRNTVPENEPSNCYLAWLTFRTLPLWEKGLIIAISVFVVMTMVIGVTDEIQAIVEKMDTYGPPFSCLLLQNARL